MIFSVFVVLCFSCSLSVLRLCSISVVLLGEMIWLIVCVVCCSWL